VFLFDPTKRSSHLAQSPKQDTVSLTARVMQGKLPLTMPYETG
jgi:hypothetical protein